MNKTTGESRELAEALVNALSDCEHKIMIAPPFTSLQTVHQVVKGTNILLGAQNMAEASGGAHTGEISASLLKDVGVSVVIIGHSERRLIYGESDELINKKVHRGIQSGLEVILCVGETLEQRNRGEAVAVVKAQIERGFEGIPEESLDKITVAYEPVWAIGTGKNATPEDADEIHFTIRESLKKIYSRQAGENMVIQYGGSVKPANIKALMAMENIDGVLVGGASLAAETFVPIARYNQ